MAHTCKKFVDVFEAQGSAIAGETVERIAQLLTSRNRSEALRLMSGLMSIKKMATPVLYSLED